MSLSVISPFHNDVDYAASLPPPPTHSLHQSPHSAVVTSLTSRVCLGSGVNLCSWESTMNWMRANCACVRVSWQSSELRLSGAEAQQIGRTCPSSTFLIGPGYRAQMFPLLWCTQKCLWFQKQHVLLHQQIITHFHNIHWLLPTALRPSPVIMAPRIGKAWLIPLMSHKKGEELYTPIALTLCDISIFGHSLSESICLQSWHMLKCPQTCICTSKQRNLDFPVPSCVFCALRMFEQRQYSAAQLRKTNTKVKQMCFQIRCDLVRLITATLKPAVA